MKKYKGIKITHLKYLILIVLVFWISCWKVLAYKTKCADNYFINKSYTRHNSFGAPWQLFLYYYSRNNSLASSKYNPRLWTFVYELQPRKWKQMKFDEILALEKVRKCIPWTVSVCSDRSSSSNPQYNTLRYYCTPKSLKPFILKCLRYGYYGENVIKRLNSISITWKSYCNNQTCKILSWTWWEQRSSKNSWWWTCWVDSCDAGYHKAPNWQSCIY